MSDWHSVDGYVCTNCGHFHAAASRNFVSDFFAPMFCQRCGEKHTWKALGYVGRYVSESVLWKPWTWGLNRYETKHHYCREL